MIVLPLPTRRKLTDAVARVLCLVTTLAAFIALISILATLFARGFAGLHWSLISRVTGPPGSGGGLLNAILGSAIQTAIGTLVGIPIGVMAGTWLAEYGRSSALATTVRFVSDMLLSAPSILIGLFVYGLLVRPFGGFSGLAGGFALAVIAIPIVVRTTEDVLRLVPVSLREAAAALGAPRWRTITRIAYPAALDGLMTGALLAVARLAGETAPLLFTSLGNLNWSVRLNRPMASLPVTIYNYAGSAYSDWVQLAWAGALVITIGVLILNLLARLALRVRVAA